MVRLLLGSSGVFSVLITLTIIAVLLEKDGDTCKRASIVLGAAAPTPYRAVETERALGFGIETWNATCRVVFTVRPDLSTPATS